jgi:hypothetical protein
VLQRCGWRVLLLDNAELFDALASLETHNHFDKLCAYTQQCVRDRTAPLGCHGHRGAAGGWARQPEASPAAPAAHTRSGRAPHGYPSDSKSHDKVSGGLDGRYWQVAADEGRAGRGRRRPLGPHNLL